LERLLRGATMKKNPNRCAIVCYEYSYEISPFLNSLCSYVFDKTGLSVDVLIDDLQREKNFKARYAHIVVANSFLKRMFFGLNKQQRFIKLLRRQFLKESYKIIFAAEFLSLHYIEKTGVDLSSVIFLSLEGSNYIRQFQVSNVTACLAKCRRIVLADEEREKDLKAYLGLYEAHFYHLPVSLRPMKVNLGIKKHETKCPCLIYSGYFAEWGCLKEMINLFKFQPETLKATLRLQGHYMGTKAYLDEVNNMIRDTHNITLDLKYYSEDAHNTLLASHDIGLAFYKDVENDGNFKNILFSSGKIAKYLWNGLAVITNLDNEITKKPPFILVEIDNANMFFKGIASYLSDPDTYRQAAHCIAEKYYNFDKHADKVFFDLL
jgi:hypothetical protein